MVVLYAGQDEGPVEIDPFDPDGIEVVAFDWSAWLASIGVSGLSESSWSVSAGVVVGDGATAVLKRGKSTTPPAPSITPEHTTLAHVWVDTAKPGTYTLTAVPYSSRAGRGARGEYLKVKVTFTE